MNNLKRVLVTGGLGFIGSHAIKSLVNSKNSEIVNVDNCTYASNPENLKEINSNRYSFIKEDICNFNEISKIIMDFKPTYVLHFAAESHVDNSINNSFDFVNSNIIGTYSLLEASKRYFKAMGLDNSKFCFHHISTDEVFGDLALDAEPFSELTRYDPSSPYSATKASSDHLVRAWYRTYDLPVKITNCSNNYGPNQHEEKLIPKTIISCIKGLNIPIYGNGMQIRDWLYVEDHIDAILAVAEKGYIGRTYNVGGNLELKNLEIVNSVCEYFDLNVEEKPNKINSFHDLKEFVTDRPGHDRRYAIDCRKIGKELGWVPKTDFSTGLKNTIEWYINNIKL